MLHFGIVSDRRPATCEVRVTLEALDNLVTDWLPVLQQGSRINKGYWLPDIAEHVVINSDENIENGVVVGTIYNSEDKPDPDTSGAGVRALKLVQDGAAAFVATIRAAASGAFALWSKSSVSVGTESGNIEIAAGSDLVATAKGKVEVSSTSPLAVTAGGESGYKLLADTLDFLLNHKHVVSGPATTLLTPPDILKLTELNIRLKKFMQE